MQQWLLAQNLHQYIFTDKQTFWKSSTQTDRDQPQNEKVSVSQIGFHIKLLYLLLLASLGL